MQDFKQKLKISAEKAKLTVEKAKSYLHKPLTTLGTWYEIAQLNSLTLQSLYNPILTIQKLITKTGMGQIDQQIQSNRYIIQQVGNLEGFNGSSFIQEGILKALDNDFSQLIIEFQNGFKSDFFIINADKEFNWMLVGSRNRKNAWIYSRTPYLDNQIFDNQLILLSYWGFDISSLCLKHHLNSNNQLEQVLFNRLNVLENTFNKFTQQTIQDNSLQVNQQIIQQIQKEQQNVDQQQQQAQVIQQESYINQINPNLAFYQQNFSNQK